MMYPVVSAKPVERNGEDESDVSPRMSVKLSTFSPISRRSMTGRVLILWAFSFSDPSSDIAGRDSRSPGGRGES